MRAILVAVTTINDQYDINYSLDELDNLASAANIETVFRISQKLDKPNPKTYVGKGKLDEIIITIHAYDANIVIFNDELTPSQLRNVTDILKVECIDRSFLILKIFEQRATTKEGKLEIKLAKNMYMLPRISFLREKESRSGGASGALSSKGAGETQKELDKRHLMAEINHIKNELIQTKKMKEQQIEKRKRNDLPIVALVGYTNAGKSSTMNTILEYVAQTEKQVLAKDQLFATLSTSNRKITYEIYLTKQDSNIKTIKSNYVKFYLTDENNNPYKGFDQNKMVNYHDLYILNDKPGSVLLYRSTLMGNKTAKFKLRMWLSDSYGINQEKENFSVDIDARIR